MKLRFTYLISDIGEIENATLIIKYLINNLYTFNFFNVEV